MADRRTRAARIVVAALLWGAPGALVARVDAADPKEPQSLGEQAYHRADLTGARLAYLATLRGRPNDFQALVRLSRIETEMAGREKGELRRQLTASATEHAGRAVRLAPDSARAHLALAEALWGQSRHEGPRTRLALARQVKAEVDRALTLDPNLARAYHLRGLWNRALATRGYWDRLMGRTVRDRPRGASLEHAVQDLEKAVVLEPRDVWHRLELGRTLARLGRRAEARRELEIAAALPPAGSALDSDFQAEARDLLARLR